MLLLTLLALFASCTAIGILEAIFGLVVMLIYTKDDGVPFIVVGLLMAVLGIVGVIGWNLAWSLPVY